MSETVVSSEDVLVFLETMALGYGYHLKTDRLR